MNKEGAVDSNKICKLCRFLNESWGSRTEYIKRNGDCHLQMLPCNLQQSICSYEKRENADNTHMLSRCDYLYVTENVLDNIKGKYIACLIAIG